MLRVAYIPFCIAQNINKILNAHLGYLVLVKNQSNSSTAIVQVARTGRTLNVDRQWFRFTAFSPDSTRWLETFGIQFFLAFLTPGALVASMVHMWGEQTGFPPTPNLGFQHKSSDVIVQRSLITVAVSFDNSYFSLNYYHCS